VPKSKVILHITPETHVRATQGDRVFFRIPRDKLFPAGLKRLKRLEKYNEYKLNLSAEAKRQGFVFPQQGASVTFFVPMPKTWRKWKRELMHFKLHCSKPDLDNYLKAIVDSLCAEDKHIAHYGSLAKYWVDFPVGWIEITIEEPQLPTIEIPRSLQDHLRSAEGCAV
jgi:Holliday junction resolvase RusA-like endonuclease